MNKYVLGILVASSLFVYLDATRNRVGKIPGEGGAFNMSAGAWAMCVLGFWIVAFPAYLIKRKSLLQRALDFPVVSKLRWIKAFMLVAAPVWMLQLSTQVRKLPLCGSPEVTAATNSMVRRVPGASISELAELAYDGTLEKRLCQGRVKAPNLEMMLKFTVEWQDQEKTRFLVKSMATESASPPAEQAEETGAAPARFEQRPDGLYDAQESVLWATADNGRDIDWGAATLFCESKGAGWGLPSEELIATLFDEAGTHSSEVKTSYGVRKIMPATPQLRLTSVWFWTSGSSGSLPVFTYSLESGYSPAADSSGSHDHRALCVRRL